MKPIKGRRLLPLFLFFPLLTGCWNMEELEHMFYAHAVGVEHQNGEYHVYVQVLDFSTLGKTEGGGGGGSGGSGTGAWIGRGAGKTLYGAMHDLYASSQRKIYWGHLNTIILSDELLAGKYLEVLDLFTRYGELRYTPWLFASRDKVDDILLVSPILERSPVYSQLSDPFDVFEQSSIIPPIRLHRFFSRLLEPSSTVLLPCIGTTKNKWEDESKKYTALEVRGAYFIQNKKLKGMLSKNQLMGLRWMNEQFRRTPLVISSEKGPIASMTFEKIDTEISPRILDGKIFFDVGVSAKGSVVGMTQMASEAEIRKMAEQTIQQEIMDTFKQGVNMKADLYNLLDAAFRKMPGEWEKITASGEFPLGTDSLRSLRVDVRITNAGKNNKPLSDTHPVEHSGGLKTSFFNGHGR